MKFINIKNFVLLYPELSNLSPSRSQRTCHSSMSSYPILCSTRFFTAQCTPCLCGCYVDKCTVDYALFKCAGNWCTNSNYGNLRKNSFSKINFKKTYTACSLSCHLFMFMDRDIILPICLRWLLCLRKHPGTAYRFLYS